MATWRVLYRVLGTCFLPFHPVAHFKKCPQHFRAPSLYPVQVPSFPPPLISLSPSLSPRPKGQRMLYANCCSTWWIVILVRSTLFSVGRLEVVPPAKRLLFLVFWLISCDSFRFVPFTVTLPLSPFLPIPLNSRPSISHFSHFVAYCVAFCASLFVHFHSCPAPGRCIIKRCFFVAPPPVWKGRIGSGIVATVCQHLL